jgi:hypothetical protein
MYVEAMARPDTAEWDVACDNEKRAFEHMGVYEVVPRPKDRKVVGSKWVFHIKRGPDGTIQKYKACIVAQGFTQIEGIDYDETFAPVAKLASLHAILAIVAERDLEIHQMDVKSAYLNGALSNEIFMAPPPGFDIPDGMVLRLIKAVYGTKQGGRVWYEEISATLGAMGYQRTEADHAVYTRDEGDALSILALYVDDITMVTKSTATIDRDKAALKRAYEMTDLGEISWILGMHVSRDRAAGWMIPASWSSTLRRTDARVSTRVTGPRVQAPFISQGVSSSVRAHHCDAALGLDSDGLDRSMALY